MNPARYEGKTRYQDAAVAEYYDERRFSSMKGRLTDRRERVCIVRALQRAQVTGRVLDIPCGTGRFTDLLSAWGLEVTAADISLPMLRHARARLADRPRQVSFVKCDVERLAFPDEYFELILTIRLFHHVPPDLHEAVLAQLHRKTRRWVIASFSNRYTVQNMRRNIKYFFTGFPRYSVSPSTFRERAVRVGFEVVELIPLVPLFSESVIVLLRKTTLPKVT